MYVDLDVKRQQRMDFFTGGSVIINDGLVFWPMDWSGVDYLWIMVMFLSAVWTLILTAPIHCICEQVM